MAEFRLPQWVSTVSDIPDLIDYLESPLCSLELRLKQAKLFVERTIQMVDTAYHRSWEQVVGADEKLNEVHIDAIIEDKFADLPPWKHLEFVWYFGPIIAVSALEEFVRQELLRLSRSDPTMPNSADVAKVGIHFETLKKICAEMCLGMQCDWQALEEVRAARHAIAHNLGLIAPNRQSYVKDAGHRLDYGGLCRINTSMDNLMEMINLTLAFAKQLDVDVTARLASVR